MFFRWEKHWPKVAELMICGKFTEMELNPEQWNSIVSTWTYVWRPFVNGSQGRHTWYTYMLYTQVLLQIPSLHMVTQLAVTHVEASAFLYTIRSWVFMGQDFLWHGDIMHFNCLMQDMTKEILKKTVAFPRARSIWSACDLGVTGWIWTLCFFLRDKQNL